MCQCLNIQLKGLRMCSQVLCLMHVSVAVYNPFKFSPPPPSWFTLLLPLGYLVIMGYFLLPSIPRRNGHEQVWADVVPIVGYHTYTLKHRCMLDTTLWIIQYEDA